MKKISVFLILTLMFTLIFPGQLLAANLSGTSYTISGIVSLPDGETAPKGGLALSMDAETRSLNAPPQNGNEKYSDSVTIPEGQNSVPYSINVNKPPDGFGYMIIYRINDTNQTRYIPEGLYSNLFNGHSSQYPVATVLNVASDGNFHGINVIIGKHRTISGTVVMPAGQTASQIGIKVKLTLIHGKEPILEAEECISTDCVIPARAKSTSFSFNKVRPNERWIGWYEEIGNLDAQGYRLQYRVDGVSGIKPEGYLGLNGTVESYNDAMKINVTNNDKTGIVFQLLPGQEEQTALTLRATPGDGYITLDWTAAANTTGLDGYYLYKGTSPGGEDASPMFDFPINALTYKDTQVTNGKTYYYILKPCYNQGTLMGSASNEASATPQVNKGGTIVLTIGNPYMKINGQAIEIDPGKGTAPVIVSGRTFLPIRAVIEAMGGTVAWDGSTSKVTIVFNKQTINLWIGKTTATVNGAAKNLDVAPYISSTGRTMLPLRFVTENLGCNVIWNGPEQTVTINYGK